MKYLIKLFRLWRAEIKTLKEVDVIAVGDPVLVYDRYRFTNKPAKAEVSRILSDNSGVQVRFTAHNQHPHYYPIGSTTIVCIEQLRLDQ